MAWLPRRPLLPLELVANPTSPPTLTGFTLDAATKRAGTLFRPLPNLPLSQVGLLCQQIVGVPPTCEVRLETVLNGTPTGNLAGPATRAVFTPQANTFQWIPLEAAFTPTTGSSLALLVGWSAGTIGTANNVTIALRLPSCWSGQNPTVLQYNGTTWTPVGGMLPLVVPRHADGSLLPGTAALRSVNWTVLTTTGNPTEVGNRFIAPGDFTMDALCAMTRLPAGGRATLRLWTEAGTQVTSLDSQPLEASPDVPTTASSGVVQAPVTPCALSAGVAYICSQQSLTAAGSYIAKLTFADAAAREALFGPAWWVQRQGTGVWVEDPTSVAALSPRVSAWSVPIPNGGGGLPRHPGMCGGMVG
jgi:hypothetical protein